MELNTMQAAARSLHAMGFKTLPIKPGTKEPANKGGVKGATDDDALTDAYYSARPNDGIGISGDGFLIFDFDVKGGVDGRDELAGWKLPDTLCQTTPSGGYHMIYRTDREVHPSVNTELAVDVRGWHSYVVCDPTPGYCFEDDTEPTLANDAVYAFLEHVRPKKTAATSGENLKEGQGRNNAIFAYGCSLQSQSMSDDEIRQLMQAYNRDNFKPPLDDAELSKTINSVLKRPKGHSAEVMQAEKRQRGRPRKFEHNAIAKRLISEFGACLIDAQTPAIRINGGAYGVGWDAFDRVIIDIADDCTESNRKEVKAYIKAKAPTKRQSTPYLIAFLNGVLDVRTFELRDWREDDVICNVIPHNWNPDSRGEILDNVLYKMACGEMSTYMNLAEFIGVCMVRSAKLCPFFPVLVGAGSNGKSTYIELLQNVIGDENISSLQPKEVTARFMGSHIVGKTANLGDDIAGGYLDDHDCSVIKSIATGDLMFTDVKGGKGYYYHPYSTLVFSCNQFPRLADTTPGFMRRLFPIEFNAVFDVTDADYDPMIGEKLRNEEVLEHACVIGVEGLRRVIEQHRPTPNELSDSVKNDVAQEGNTAMMWFYDEEIKADDLRGKTKDEVYEQYVDWCKKNGYERFALGSGTLCKQIGTIFRLKLSGMCHREFSTGRRTVRVFE